MYTNKGIDAAGRAAGRERAIDDGIVPKRQWKRENVVVGL
jgi:hypothetical protein